MTEDEECVVPVQHYQKLSNISGMGLDPDGAVLLFINDDDIGGQHLLCIGYGKAGLLKFKAAVEKLLTHIN